MVRQERGMIRVMFEGMEKERKAENKMAARYTKNHERSNYKHHEMGRQRVNNNVTADVAMKAHTVNPE